MIIKVNKHFLVDLLVYLPVSLYLIFNLLNTTFYAKYIPTTVYSIIYICSILLLLLHELLVGKFSLNSILGVFVFFILAILVILSEEGLSSYLYTLALIFLVRQFSFKKISKVILILTTIFLIFTILSSKLGIIPDYVEVSSNRIRHYLGFRYSLFPSTVMLNITALYLYVKQSRIKLKELIVLAVSILWIFLQTNSRLAFLSSSVLILVSLVLKFYPDLLKKTRYILLFFTPSFIYFAIVSYVIANRYVSAGSFLRVLNSFLGGRIYLASKSISIYGFGWLGKQIQWIGNGLTTEGLKNTSSYLYVDNLYIQVLQRYGVLFLFIFITLLTITMFILYKEKQYFLILILILLAAYATIDDLEFRLHYNSFLLLLGTPFSMELIRLRLPISADNAISDD